MVSSADISPTIFLFPSAPPASSKLDTQTPSLVGAVGSPVDAPASATRAISGLRLDDEQEFPPMAHRSET